MEHHRFDVLISAFRSGEKAPRGDRVLLLERKDNGGGGPSWVEAPLRLCVFSAFKCTDQAEAITHLPELGEGGRNGFTATGVPIHD